MDRSGKKRVAKIWIDDGILYFEYHPNTVLSLEKAQQTVKYRLSIQKDKYYPICCDTSGLVDSHKMARDYLAREGSILASAVAYIAPDDYSYKMISFFIRNSKPRIPSKVFRHKFAALNFLRAFKTKSP
ncbi:DUF7793 family protein [Zunongwangia endophytica]|uniref:DUF7793 domain-containing protein n=1 Tax=Zunongwangia endophytica TaxID=1808945 RepID=A0ABV8H970_9FLAO|nr:hypothetical protein [Zunongwangia endophytica]MDN3594387.1 hypothetical protein [Zunongwangia endophytica]